MDRYIPVSVDTEFLSEEWPGEQTIYLVVDTDPLPNSAAPVVVRTLAAHLGTIVNALNASVAP